MQQSLEYYIDHSTNKEGHRLYDHEYLLSFNNDGGAYAFEDWWRSIGFFAYKKWCEENLKELNESYG